MLRGLAAEEGCAFADFYSAMTGDDGETLCPALSFDGLHPHHAGYVIMTRILDPMLDTLV